MTLWSGVDMVFFTSIIIVAIFYYLQSDGLIYITIIALVAEMINIFLTHTLTKSVEEKMKKRHRRAVQGYLNRIKTNKRTIKDLERVQDDAAGKLYKANETIKTLEAEIAKLTGTSPPVDGKAPPSEPPKPEKKAAKRKAPQEDKSPPSAPVDMRNHLPDGSKRKRPPG
ncbi:MAG TPA: hypothetical protein DHV36_16350 [Desulfobacteraceae bacterium]|nr:hypothetical protein [Desulfobacteraceae bacterium]|tara:strand:- start:372 stop:878 length:507 start_codon:yes stop_codon:yes gene_type:complete